MSTQIQYQLIISLDFTKSMIEVGCDWIEWCRRCVSAYRISRNHLPKSTTKLPDGGRTLLILQFPALKIRSTNDERRIFWSTVIKSHCP